ncbi:(Fe-S)-binding protein [Burkholderia sp. MSh2]|uniref:Iron-sulfur cluster-binding protein n=1 Tax=Burkholderia paludis TaxID=1506587 RepID=A0A6P2PZM1_9BURK|nr:MULTISPECIES: M24 family metallopeptidase [Burkholderia]KEZ04557.1 (Fe-S)-binding protein [Burkholderia sp. MSh2]KFG93859.1 (Fe-S)-binding protein [Burkholderia paludis]VWC11360.1 iron-sulfur cluster-binding protein [Burkholderia paludis]
MNSTHREAVGEAFSLDAMQHARTMTWEAVDAIAAGVRPGMRESEANALGLRVLGELGMDRIWHPVLVRFGENTLKKFNERSTGDPVLADDDIFFIDLGAVWAKHEGDAGATFVCGDDPDMRACADAAKAIYAEVEHHWRTTGCAGIALYEFAAQRADAHGFRLNVDIKGHRVSDFPHAIYKAGNLGDFDAVPAAGLWILEIQIAHPTRPFGAFYEDLLV